MSPPQGRWQPAGSVLTGSPIYACASSISRSPHTIPRPICRLCAARETSKRTQQPRAPRGHPGSYFLGARGLFAHTRICGDGSNGGIRELAAGLSDVLFLQQMSGKQTTGH